MKKYLVIAQTYKKDWGAEYHLFAICDSKEEAIKFVMNNPVQQIEEDTFNFFNDYEEIGENIISKEEYVKEQFIVEFNGSPIYIGGYIE